MATRNVWSKWNVSKVLTQYSENPYSGFCLNSNAGSSPVIYYSSNVNINADGTLTLVSPVTYTEKSNNWKNLNGFYWNDKLSGNMVYRDGKAQIMLRADDDGVYYQIWGYGADSSAGTVKFYKATVKAGGTSYGNVSSISANAYPADNYSGNYWYTLLGTDVIDPASVSYDTPHGGELLDIIVTPSASIQYGGTISYKYEISTDGGVTWDIANASTTATTISVLVPAGAETFQARVTASDDMGFTSTDAVMGESMNVINNTAPVITCMVLNLGKLAAAFSVDYSVSDEDGDELTITEAVDGVKIRDFAIPSGGGTR